MLRLPFRSRVWRGAAGEFTGSGTGSSMDFQDHRSYNPGDDPRHINWNAYARTGQYSMKLFREEIRPVVDLILDASPSMFFTKEKAKRTADLVKFLTESSIASGASVQIFAISGDQHKPIDPLALGSQDWQSLFGSTEAASPAPNVSRIPLRSSAFRVFISDLLFPADPSPILQALGQKHGTPILFAPFLKAEANPEWSGNYDFIDAENQSRHPHRIEPATLRRYKESYSSHFRQWEQAALRYQTPLARIPCEDDLISSLYQHALPVKAVETTN